MRDLLQPRHRAALAAFLAPAAGRVLLAFDFDGVLAPIVHKPGGARMRPRTRALLTRLAEREPVAVISGRSLENLAAMVDGTVPHLVGNHGYELLRPVRPPAAVLRRVRGWQRQLGEALAGIEGVRFEDKGATFAVHYGQARPMRRAEEQVFRAAADLDGVRLIPGKRVLNVLPHDFPTKGDAVRTLVKRLGCRAALFLGDDVTDEDAFVVGPPLVFGVHVGQGPSLAPWRLRRQEDVDVLLRRILELRA
ncbi:MAG: trehalose-phosphatase [Anaeromyxobacter sp.]